MDFALSEETPGWSLKRLLGPAAGEKLAALAWNRDLREIKPHRRARSAGAQSAIGRKPAEERVFRPTLLHLADRIGTRLRAKSRPGRTVTVRVCFANLNSARSAGAQPAIGRKPAEERVFRPTLLHLSDFKMNPAAPAARLECPVGRRTVPSIRSAIASDGMLLATAR